MRHRSQPDETGQPAEVGNEGSTLIQRATQVAPVPGKHRAPGVAPRLPLQKRPLHDTVFDVPAPAPITAAEPEVAQDVQPEIERDAEPEHTIPLTAQWRASHLPRTIAATVLAGAVIGTAGLGVRYAQVHSSGNFVSLAVGLAVVVILWAVLIASTPQVVNISGSVLTVHTTGGVERFDLVDALQPVDVVGNPRTSHWAVLLHRPNGTTQVLRHHDVDAVELDPIVRHYRNVATQRFAEREARFNLKRARPLGP